MNAIPNTDYTTDSTTVYTPSTKNKQPEEDDFTAFFEALIRDTVPNGQYIHIWRSGINGKPRHTEWVRTVAEAVKVIERNKLDDMYAGVSIAPKGKSTERISNKTATGLLALPADIDIQDDVAHKHTTYPKNIDEAMALLEELELPPTLVVHSGHGLQAWWVFETPWVFNGEVDKKRAERLMKMWQNHIRLKGEKHGWVIDNVGDLSRLLRIPGTMNNKNRDEPEHTKFMVYNYEDMYLPEVFEAVCADDLRATVVESDSLDLGAVSEDQRYTVEHPCPVCNGNNTKPQGIGERCWGFISSDKLSAFCTREEYGGDLEPIAIMGSDHYKHALWGPCKCGETHAATPQGQGPEEGRALWSVQYFSGLYRDRLRYVALFNRWYVNNGKWWEPDDEKSALRLGYEAVYQLYENAHTEPNPVRKREWGQLAVKLDSSDKVHTMVADSGAFEPIAARKDAFDRDDWKVVCANGIIDLQTGDLLPHDPTAMHSKHLGPTSDSIEYDPNAKCPNWDKFLKTIFPESDGEEMIAYLQRAAFYTLTGSIREQCAFFLLGEGANGKSTFTDAISEILGTYYEKLYTETLLSSKSDRVPTDLAKLVGARGAFASESPQNRHLDEAALKIVTGDQQITARFMRQDFFTYQQKFKVWLHTNYLPKIRGTDLGIWRRIRVIPFQYTLGEHEKITDFYATRLRPELPGILAWAMRGREDYLWGGLQEPERVTNAREEYREQSNTLKEFLDDYVHEEIAENQCVSAALVYKVYCDWCRQQNEKSESQKALGLAIKKKFNVESIAQRTNGRLERVYPGLSVDLSNQW